MSEARDFDEVWSFVEEKLGPVPPYFKYILKYCGFNNGVSIAAIDDDDIQHMVFEVRIGNVNNYYKPLKDVLEGSTKNMENFEFSRGHLKFLKAIVEFLKKYAEENGPDSFKTTKQNKKPKINKPKGKIPSIPRNRIKLSEDVVREIDNLVHSSEMDNDIEKQKKILLKRMLGSLIFRTSKLYKKYKSKIHEKLAADQLVIVKMGKSEDQNSESEKDEISDESPEESTKIPKYKASMFCPYCSKKINAFYKSSWKSSNFDRHLNHTHSETTTETVESDNKSDKTRNKSEDKCTDAKNGAESTDDNTITEKDDCDVVDPRIVDDHKNLEADVMRAIGTPKTASTEKATVIEIDSDDNLSDVMCTTAVIETDSLINMPIAQCSRIGKRSKNLVCYSESDNSDCEVSGQMQQQNQSRWCGDTCSSESEPEPSMEPRKTLVFKGNEKPTISKAEREAATNQPSTSRQILGQITNQKMNLAARSRIDLTKDRKRVKYI